MSTRPVLVRHARARPAIRLVTAAARARRLPTAGALARRRWTIRLAKWLLPAVALALLSMLALWPELERPAGEARLSFREMAGNIGGARLTDARYHAVDKLGRPYTVTAAVAQQQGPDRINLTLPMGDITLKNGAWLMLEAKRGVYLQKQKQLDLSRDVKLYRDDGTTMETDSASIDLKRGAAGGSQPVHAQGPFGTLYAKGGFTAVDKGTVVQFAGPAKVVLNGAQP